MSRGIEKTLPAEALSADEAQDVPWSTPFERAPARFRDARDVKAIMRRDQVLLALALLLTASGALNVVQYWRKPSLVIMKETADGSGRVVLLDDRTFGEADGVALASDKLTDQDKLYITQEFAGAVYGIDPATRRKDLERALRMMVPGGAKALADDLTRRHQIETEKKESWQAVWTKLDASVDKRDPWTVRVIGKQELTKVVQGATVTESHQYSLTIKLVADSQGRADRNLRSGALVAGYEWKELGAGESPTEGR